MRKETRIMSKDEAIAFIQNMRWFAGFGPIRSRECHDGQYAVTASVAAWSNWVS